MENSLLIGLSRQAALGHQLDVIANNLANMRTAGFKSQTLLFEEHIMPVAEATDATLSDSNVSYVIDGAMIRDFSPGEYQRTGNTFDVAIEGKGWLAVQTPQGERYTRAGALQLNAQGQLVTSAGYPVLGTGGPITFGSSETGIAIATDGTVSSSTGEKGKLRLVSFQNEALLKQEGANLFSSSEPPQEATQYRIFQGMVESSNVKPVVETTRMIEVTRAYVSAAQLMDSIQELNRDAIAALAEVPV